MPKSINAEAKRIEQIYIIKNAGGMQVEDKVQQLWDRQEKLEERIRLVENQQAGTIIYIKEIKEDLQEIKADLKKIKPSDIKSEPRFWQTDTGKFVVRTLCIIGVIIVMAAIGMNYFKEYLGVIK